MAFFAFLRCGEFTVDSVFDHNVHLCVGDVRIFTDFVTLHLKASKTDPFRKGIDIHLFKSGSVICPYTIICKYLTSRNKLSSHNSILNADITPLFVTDHSLRPLSRNVFIRSLRHVLDVIGLKSSNYHGHSFRIGAATSAASAQVEDHLIKVLGRWSSDSYCRYIRTPQSVLKQAQRAMMH